jgi:hypothetical protein
MTARHPQCYHMLSARSGRYSVVYIVASAQHCYHNMMAEGVCRLTASCVKRAGISTRASSAPACMHRQISKRQVREARPPSLCHTVAAQMCLMLTHATCGIMPLAIQYNPGLCLKIDTSWATARASELIVNTICTQRLISRPQGMTMT